MAGPCAVIGALATLAGTGLQIAGAAEARAAANRAVRAELLRQRKYQERSSSALEKSLAAGTPEVAARQLGEGTAERLAEYSAAHRVPLTVPASAGAASPARLISAPVEAARSQLSDAARARLAGYTEWDLQQAIKNLRASQEQAMLGSFSQGSVGVLPIELNAAQHAGDTLSGVGNLLSGLGSLASTYAYAKPGVGAVNSLTATKFPTSLSSRWDKLLGMWVTPGPR